LLREGIRLRLMSSVRLRPARADDLESVLGLVRSASLPEDLAPHFASFFVADRDGSVVGAVGLERVSNDRALLRSLVVARASRSGGLGTSLADAAIRRARAIGVGELFLLTTDAAPFFERLGFERVPHADAPPAVRRTREFSEFCPSTAQLMKLVL
jgi:N-acetylglutamate synthase-like GNAT family acetyltransferase